MKKRTLAAIILSVALATVATTAYAASYEGKIWTGKPTIFQKSGKNVSKLSRNGAAELWKFPIPRE